MKTNATQFQRLFESAPDIYFVLDAKLNVVAATDRLLDVAQTTRDAFVGQNIFEVVAKRSGSQAVENLRHSIESVQRDLVNNAMEVQQYDVGDTGHTRYWCPENIPVLDENGELEFIIHRIEDVTEVVQLRRLDDEHKELNHEMLLRQRKMQADILRRSEQLQTANRELQASDAAKSAFLSRMSHELRTPLTAIIGFNDLLASSALDPEHDEYVKATLRAARQLLALVDEVLDVSSIEAGNLPMFIETISARRAIDDAHEFVRNLAAENHISLATEISDEVAFFADRHRVRQVFVNLLSNAINYNSPGGSVTTAVEVAGASVQITISDTGPGMSQADLRKLFTPFERLDATRRGISGVGLGLVLAQRFTQAMNGKLSIDSKVGDGTCVTVELPAAAAIDLRTPERPVQTLPENPHTLVYVEDTPDNILLVRAILKLRPAITFVAIEEGTAAIDVIRHLQPDLVLLDLHLPDINGDEVLRRLQADDETKNIPVVMLSADVSKSAADRLISSGARSYITKPVGVDELLELVDSYITATELSQ